MAKEKKDAVKKRGRGRRRRANASARGRPGSLVLLVLVVAAAAAAAAVPGGARGATTTAASCAAAGTCPLCLTTPSPLNASSTCAWCLTEARCLDPAEAVPPSACPLTHGRSVLPGLLNPSRFGPSDCPRIEALDPARGDPAGGTRVAVSGQSFIDDDTLKCMFGTSAYVEVHAEYVAIDELRCIAPAWRDGPAAGIPVRLLLGDRFYAEGVLKFEFAVDTGGLPVWVLPVALGAAGAGCVGLVAVIIAVAVVLARRRSGDGPHTIMFADETPESPAFATSTGSAEAFSDSGMAASAGSGTYLALSALGTPASRTPATHYGPVLAPPAAAIAPTDAPESSQVVHPHYSALSEIAVPSAPVAPNPTGSVEF